jgi:hypothetical protein
MKATGIPFLLRFSIKGVLRDARRAIDSDKTKAVFVVGDTRSVCARMPYTPGMSVTSALSPLLHCRI